MYTQVALFRIPSPIISYNLLYLYPNLHLNNMRTLHVVICIAITLLLSIKPYEATRILDEEEEERVKKISPPSPNSCSNTPGNGGSPCSSSTISQRNFAGQVRAVAPPPPPPNANPWQNVQFGIAANLK